MKNKMSSYDNGKVVASKGGRFSAQLSAKEFDEKVDQVFIGSEDVEVIIRAVSDKPRLNKEMAKAHNSAKLLFS